MPRVSDLVGFRCSRPGCGSFCRVVSTKPLKSGKIVERLRVCRTCGHKQRTREATIVRL